MRSKLLFILITGLFAANAAFAQSAPVPPADKAAKMQQKSDQHFTKLDKDNDGSISRDEAAGHELLAKNFDAIDTNKDGKLTKEELRAHREATRGKHMDKFKEHFKAADKDSDGALTKAEAEAGKMTHIVKNFDQIDTNKDGNATREELHAFAKTKHPRVNKSTDTSR